MSLSARNWAIRQRHLWDAAEGKWVPMNHGNKIVLLCLAEHTNLTERVAYPGIARIALWCCMGQRTVNDHLRALENGRLIGRSKRDSWDGRWQRNEYVLNLPDDQWEEDDRYLEEHNISF